MTLPIIEGTDGVKKMSKSFGNAISIGEDARNMFGKLMSIPDRLASIYAEYAGGMTDAELKEFLEKFKADPREGKADLAEYLIVGRSHEFGARAGLLTFDKKLARTKGVSLV